MKIMLLHATYLFNFVLGIEQNLSVHSFFLYSDATSSLLVKDRNWANFHLQTHLNIYIIQFIHR